MKHDISISVHGNAKLEREANASAVRVRLQLRIPAHPVIIPEIKQRLYCCNDLKAPDYLRPEPILFFTHKISERMKQNNIWKRGRVLNGRYQLLDSLGSGGMSEVFLACDLEDGLDVAVKKDSGHETEILFKLDHEGIVWALDYFYFQGEKYLVEEYVEGEDLRSLVRKEGPFSIAEAFEIGLQLCEILEYLHGQSPPVIYRDLKPQNILMEKDGNVKLIDFGIAREYFSRTDYDTTSYGTPGYAAPEQFEGSLMQSDGRTDLFALGKVLCFLISGAEPKKQGRDPARLIPDPEAAEIIKVCLKKDPEERWQSASELAYELERWLKGGKEYAPSARDDQRSYAPPSKDDQGSNAHSAKDDWRSYTPPERDDWRSYEPPARNEGAALWQERDPDRIRQKQKRRKASVNPVAVLLTLIAVLLYFGGGITGLARVYEALQKTVPISWMEPALIWSVSFASGTLILGFAQIIKLLTQIRNRLREH